MGLFSSGNKDEAPSRRSKAPADRSGEGRRTRGEGRSQQGSLLDPTLPEKQRARHRLIGAIAMVLAAVIGLPMVLDSHPRPASDDIAIDIPGANKSATVQTAAPAPDQSIATSTTSTADTSTPAKPSPLASSSAAANKPANKSTAVTTVVAGLQASPGAPAAAAPMEMPPTSADTVPAGTVTPAVAPAAPAPHLPASQAGSRFVVSVGSFTSDTSAHAWLNKLKGAGVPAYLEQKRQPDGSPRILLRAGPFSDRSSAEAAVKKVRDAGLSAQSNEASGAAK